MPGHRSHAEASHSAAPFPVVHVWYSNHPHVLAVFSVVICIELLIIARQQRCSTGSLWQDLASCQIRATKLSELLRKAESARRSAEEYARKLEAKFETSGRGVALLKAAKLHIELKAMQVEAQAMQEAYSDKVICEQRNAADTLVHTAGFDASCTAGDYSMNPSSYICTPLISSSTRPCPQVMLGRVLQQHHIVHCRRMPRWRR
jgi:hypothetical protein